VRQAAHHAAARHTLAAAAAAPPIRRHDPARQHRPTRLQPLPRHLQAELIQPAERGQVRAAEGSVTHVEVFLLGGVRTPIIGGPRPLPRDRRADPTYTLNCEEPLYLAPGLGHLRLIDLTSLDVEALFAAMRVLGADLEPARGSITARLLAARKAPPRKPLSETTIRRVHAALRSALNSAVRRHLIAYNPALHVELPSARRPRAVVWTEDEVRAWKQGSDRPSVAVWTGEQLGAFLDAVSDDRLYPLFHLIAYRGLRRGEAVGLRWRDVDLDRGVLRVSQQVVQLGWITQTSDPKTDAGARTLPLDEDTVAVLKRRRDQQQLEWKALDDASPQADLVFTREDGAGLHPGEVSARFRRLVKAAGLPPIRLHDLRHTSASLALAAGVPMKVVSDLLGHSTVIITADTYTSVLPEVAQEAANALAKIIPRASAGRSATPGEAAESAALDGLATTRFPIGSHSGPSEPSRGPSDTGEGDKHAGQ
jgi:integrase